MAEIVPYKVYKQTGNYNINPNDPNSAKFGDSVYFLAQGSNTPYGQQEVTAAQLQTEAPDVYAKFAPKLGTPSGYVLNNGVLTTQSALDEQAANEAAASVGTMVKVPFGSGFGYIPSGTASATNYEQNIANRPISTTSTTQPAGYSMDAQGTITLPNGQRISKQDPNYETYLQQGGLSQTGGQTSPLAEGRKLGPTEFANLRQELGVGEANFDQYFTRDAQGNIYLKPNVDTGVINTASGAVGQLPSNTTTGDLGSRTILDNEALKSSTSDVFGDLGVDFGSFLQQQQVLQQQYLQSIAPTQQEVAIQDQIINLRQQLSETELSAQAGLDKIEAEPIPTPFIVGQQRELAQQATRQLQALNSTEQTLLQRLGLAETQRQTKVQQAQVGLQFSQQNISNLLAIQNSIRQYENDVFNRAATLRADARNTLSLMLDQFQGLDAYDLDTQTQQQLAQLSTAAGIPPNLLFDGMSVVKDQLLAEQLTELTKGNVDTFKLEMDLRKEFNSNDVVKQYQNISRSYRALNSVYQEAVSKGTQESKAAADQALVTLYNKMLDPTSVVREGEYARSFEGQSAIARVQGYLERISAGGAGLTDANRKDMVDVAKLLFNDANTQFRTVENQYVNIADGMGLNSTNVVGGTSENIATVGLPQLSQSFLSLEDLLATYPSYTTVADQLFAEDPSLAPNDLLRILQDVGSGFSSDLSKSIKGSNMSNLSNGPAKLSRLGSGTITGINGSSLWEYGLDFVLEGGKGARVPSPFDGTVTFVGTNGGFGKQVRIKTKSGEEVWLSHLDGFNVRPGQNISIGQIIGTQGNSGSVLSGDGKSLTPYAVASGRGTHLDITIKKPDGGYFTAKEVATLLGYNKIV